MGTQQSSRRDGSCSLWAFRFPNLTIRNQPNSDQTGCDGAIPKEEQRLFSEIDVHDGRGERPALVGSCSTFIACANGGSCKVCTQNQFVGVNGLAAKVPSDRSPEVAE